MLPLESDAAAEKQSSHMNQNQQWPGRGGAVIRFFLVLGAMLVACTVAWQVGVADRLYCCHDGMAWGFLRPGGWVHPPVAVVQDLHGGRFLGGRDTIKSGWSEPKLWCLWTGLLSVSVLVSLVATVSGRRRWT